MVIHTLPAPASQVGVAADQGCFKYGGRKRVFAVLGQQPKVTGNMLPGQIHDVVAIQQDLPFNGGV